MLRKGDVLAVARVAGVMAAKRTAEIVPLAHSGLGIEGVWVGVEAMGGEGEEAKKGHRRSGQGGTNEGEDGGKQGIGNFGGVRITTTVECTGKTGVEMEALTGVMGAALTVVDMCKAVDKGLRIEGVRVVRKEGGRSGAWREEGWEDGEGG